MPDHSPEIPPATSSADGKGPATSIASAGSPRRDPAQASTPAARRAGRGRPDFSSSPIASRDLALIALQLALATILVWQFHLEEGRHLLFAMLAAFGGFLVNVRLPARWRPAWFLTVSIIAIVSVLSLLPAWETGELPSAEGWADSLMALSIAGSLIAAATLPIALPTRTILILLLAAGLTWLRSSSTAAFWPVVGSMFMFRMISWLQAARARQQPETLTTTAGYFLMLPNAFFPLFPVVDAKVFRETWHNDEPRAIYQTGVHWISAGLLHLFLYRLIKYEVLPSPLAVRTLSDAMLYLAANYALYLRVSGHFHLICGLLHLFGWNLPRTHDHYFLAASFSEIWRRINIYWKDFLMKTFFYPAYFWLRTRLPIQGSRRDEVSIGLAVMWVFFWTWLAHSWQTFWILGRFPFLAEHGFIWMGVGFLVAGSVLMDFRRASKPRVVRNHTWREAAVHSLKVLSTFTLVCLFWAHWTNPETFQYLLLIVASRISDAGEVFEAIAWVLAAFLALIIGRMKTGRRDARASRTGREHLDRQARWTLAALTTAVVLAAPGSGLDSLGAAGAWVRGLQEERLTAAESAAVVEGYYEELNERAEQSSPYLGNPRKSREDRGGRFTAMLQPRDDILQYEPIPGWRGEFAGGMLTINRWGMRDRDRSLLKPAGNKRIALVGSSVIMGYGVDDDETLPRLLEERLNSGKSPDETSIEVLNFGVGQYWAIHRRAQIEHKVLQFRPDMIVYIAHQDELFHYVRSLAICIEERVDLEDPRLENTLRELGIQPGDREFETAAVLNRNLSRALEDTYRRIASLCASSRVDLQYVYLPMPGYFTIPVDPKSVLQIAAKSGINTTDLSGWDARYDPAELTIGGGDSTHLNPKGNRLVVEELVKRLRLPDPIGITEPETSGTDLN